MSGGDVHGGEMNEPHEFDDAAADALLGGGGREIDPDLADLIGDMRVAYTSTPPVVGAPLAALMGASLPAADQPFGRFERMRRSLLAKCGAAFAVAMAATSGLAVAGALPPPVQNALSHLGVGESSNHHHATTASETDDTTTTTTTTTTVPGETPTTVAKDHPDNHGDEVSGVAHDDGNEGCEHGHAVAAVASGGKSQGQPCKTTPTTVEGTTPTSEAEHHGNDNGNDNGDQNENENENGDGHNGKQDDNGDGHHTTPTTTATNDGGHHGDHNGGTSGSHD